MMWLSASSRRDSTGPLSASTTAEAEEPPRCTIRWTVLVLTLNCRASSGTGMPALRNRKISSSRWTLSWRRVHPGSSYLHIGSGQLRHEGDSSHPSSTYRVFSGRVSDLTGRKIIVIAILPGCERAQPVHDRYSTTSTSENRLSSPDIASSAIASALATSNAEPSTPGRP